MAFSSFSPLSHDRLNAISSSMSYSFASFLWSSGDQIFSIHVQPSGPRFATAGGDCQVRIWSLLPALDARQENDSGAPKLLTTLTEHNGPANVVRFAHHADRLATGSDDCTAFVYDYRGSTGGAMLGAESSVESWRPRHILRGHSSHIVDLAWSKDDAMLATASLDNTIAIWDTSNGHRIITLTAHMSFVKGVAWDPIGTYLATQSEDKSIIIWRIEDWTLVARVTTPFDRMLTSTFACRLAWSPDGQYLLAGNSFQGATHAAVAVPREKWDNPDEYLLMSGHGGAVVATGFSPRLFHIPPLGGAGPPREEVGTIFALGAQDKKVTVWATSSQRPLFVGQRLFKHGQVTDLSWAADGYSLLAVSSDGTVACLQFETSEFGKPATDAETDEVIRLLYGSARGRSARRVLAESADQLEMEFTTPSHGVNGEARIHNSKIRKGTDRSRHERAHNNALMPLPLAQQQSQRSTGTMQALDARLEGDSIQGGVTQTGFGSTSFERRSVEGTIHKGTTAASLAMPPPAPRPSLGGDQGQRQIKRARINIGAMSPAKDGRKDGAQLCQPVLLRAPSVQPSLRIPLGKFPAFFSIGRSSDSRYAEIHITNKKEGVGSIPRVQSKHQAEASMILDGRLVWNEVIQGSYVVAAAGTHLFSALATDDGHIFVYSPKGRRITAPFRAGSGIAFLAAGASAGDDILHDGDASNADRRLLLITTSGMLRVIDAVSLKHVAAADVSPILIDGVTIQDARFTVSGAPVVSLSNATAYTWDDDLQGWLRIADESMTLSRFSPMMNMAILGDVGSVQSTTLAGVGMPIAAGSSFASTAAQISRGHVETNLAAAIVMESPKEYLHWLKSYVKLLTDQADKGRLEELCQALLGRPSGSGPDPWNPEVLGMPKRDLLKTVVAEQIRQNRELDNELLSKYLKSLEEIEGEYVDNQSTAVVPR